VSQRLLRSCWLGLIVAAAGCGHAPPKNERAIHSIHIDGAHQVEADDIKDKLLTSEPSWVPFSSKQYFDPDVWKTDLRRIERYYRARGYYQARVVGSEVAPHDDEVDVHAKVEEGRPTLVGKVQVTGLDALPAAQQDALLSQIAFKEGQVFLEERFEGLKQHLLQTLEEQGYAEGKVEGEAKVGLDTQRADISIRVDPGPRYHFGAVSARERPGSRVEPWRITEQARVAMPPTDWYSLTGQSEAQRRVFQMGVFGAVKVRPQEADPLSLTVPIEVQTQESPFHTLRIGGGIAVDQERQAGRVFGQYLDRDWKGGLRQLTLGGTVGWSWIPTSWSANSNGPVGELSAELQQPRLYFRDLKADLRLKAERGLEPAYKYWGAQAKVGLVWQPTPYLSFTPSYNFEYYRLQTGVAQL
jgi:translocation and assembly module TamA